MADYNARADLYRLEMLRSEPGKKLSPRLLDFNGSVAECVEKVMAKRAPDRQLYSMTTSLEAGFCATEFLYRDIEALYGRPDFPRT